MTVSLHITKLFRRNQCHPQKARLDLVSFCSLAHWFNIYECIRECDGVFQHKYWWRHSSVVYLLAPGNYFQSLLPRKS